MLRPGPWLLRWIYTPLQRAHDSWRSGGPHAQRRTAANRRAMRQAAEAIGALPDNAGERRLSVHLLTGHAFWEQTAFCLHSLARRGGVQVQATLYDDGTLTPREFDLLTRLGPAVTLSSAAGARERVETLLPKDRFPALRERWANYPHIRKLIDVHLGSAGWKLVLDSDVLFFRTPAFLLRWSADPQQPVHALDTRENYGYPRILLEALTGAPLPEKVNVGVSGWRSDAIDWTELEHWCQALLTRHGTSYYLEQALVAMLAARTRCVVAPAQEYLTFPDRQEVGQPTAVMHHYVDTSKRWYFEYGWRHVVDQSAAPRGP